MVRNITKLGITVELFHPESASGQFEIVTKYSDALSAVDNLICMRADKFKLNILVTRQAIFQTALKYGYKATFAPKLFAMQAGTASHVHVNTLMNMSLIYSYPYGKAIIIFFLIRMNKSEFQKSDNILWPEF